MKNLKFISVFSVLVLFTFSIINAQYSTADSLNPKYLNWHNKDLKTDKVPGVSVDKAYQDLIKDLKPRKTIIVAVIDGGVDTAHADLKGQLWKNPKEIPGNGKDDDNNGYVDDVYGWNFLGNSKGENLDVDNLEVTRVVRKYAKDFDKYKSESEVPSAKLNDYQLYATAKKEYDKKLKKYAEELKQIEAFEKKYTDAEDLLKNFLKKDVLTASDIDNISTDDEKIKKAKTYLSDLNKKGFSLSDLNDMKSNNSLYLNKYLNIEFSSREIVGDNPEDINDTNYGNNDVQGPDAGHGTLCAGLIAAVRNNGIGINGIASDVKIMTLRIVPDGDERDKDVALAIMYAVDNGANVINMSFGKLLSPQKKFVDDAIKYAESKNVLLIHSAGNDGLNNDSIEHYPSATFSDGTKAKTMLNIGASNYTFDKNYPAIFSNYGMSVDFFAPGVNISSTVPGNKYSLTNGTSFSTPITSGVAALVWSYYPELTAVQLKEILLKSVSSQSKLKVYKPGRGVKVRQELKFSKLCKTGGTVNAYNALKLAKKYTSEKNLLKNQ